MTQTQQAALNQYGDIYERMKQFFKPMGKPKPGEWLHQHPERGQTMKQYLDKNNPIMRAPNTIYLLPLEDNISQAFTQRLELIVKGFYCTMNVKVLSPLSIDKLKVQSRQNGGRIQYHAGQLIERLRQLKPKDSFCMVGFLLSDIYPRDEWNFVFGLADCDVYTGVFSFARYHESFYKEGITPNYDGCDDMTEVTFRSCSVLVHEIGHLFDLRHCISFKCAMNGSNSLEETVSKPFLFCPQCLQKIVFKLKTDPLTLLTNFKEALEIVGGTPFLKTASEVQRLIDCVIKAEDNK